MSRSAMARRISTPWSKPSPRHIGNGFALLCPRSSRSSSTCTRRSSAGATTSRSEALPTAIGQGPLGGREYRAAEPGSTRVGSIRRCTSAPASRSRASSEGLPSSSSSMLRPLSNQTTMRTSMRSGMFSSRSPRGSELTRLDPVTLAVIQNGLQQVCNEMDLAFVRAAFSPVIAEGLDRSDGIYDRATGELIAQGELGLPVFVGTMQFSTRAVIERAKAIEEGDIFILNDPYLGGTHLMDVKFVKPFFYRGRHFAWLANTGHWPDTGGMVPGGFSAHATEVEQEGLRLPPVKLFKGGQIDEEILSIVLSNIRIADERIGDIKAQAAALAIGERRLTILLDRYGEQMISDSIRELKVRAAQQMRAKIRTLPDGIYEAETVVDSDGVIDEPLFIGLRIEKSDDTLLFDFSKSSPPCRGPMNSVIATRKSAGYVALKLIFPELPSN